MLLRNQKSGGQARFGRTEEQNHHCWWNVHEKMEEEAEKYQHPR